jgi:hypothetical protein
MSLQKTREVMWMSVVHTGKQMREVLKVDHQPTFTQLLPKHSCMEGT